ncbi:MAG: hypothetical protein FWH05_02385 [Oscillospiraceae bacterium]|nr:hypothetical protein [Oscillospiraceae bacterium]
MYKVEVKMNEEKILAEKKYSLEKIYETLDESFIKEALMDRHWVEPDGTRVYIATKLKHKDHYAMIHSELIDYTDEEWFLKNVLKFIYGNSHGSDDINDFSYEDILEEMEVGKSIA